MITRVQIRSEQQLIAPWSLFIVPGDITFDKIIQNIASGMFRFVYSILYDFR